MPNCLPVRICKWFLCVLFLLIWMKPGVSRGIDISDAPMEVLRDTAPPILIFLLDNSGSMNCELMTDEPYGLYQGKCLLFHASDDAAPNGSTDDSGLALTHQHRLAWKTQWAGYNRIYYSPHRAYAPWPATQKFPYTDADMQRPISDPARGAGSPDRTSLAGTFFVLTGGASEIRVLNAHYFARAEDEADHIYLVTWTDDDRDGRLDVSGAAAGDARRYYRFIDDGDGLVQGRELTLVTDASEKDRIRPVVRAAAGGFVRYATDREELQNFANWFSFHRRRLYAAKAAVARLLTQTARTYVGLYAIHEPPRVAVHPVDRLSADDAVTATNVESLLDALYAMRSGGRTPLRRTLDEVGRYCHETQASSLGDSPFVPLEAGGGCQRASVVLVTDGFGNGPPVAVGNVDGKAGRPYADDWPDTLADVAMYYYENDLAPGLADDLAPVDCDDAAHQHLTTYTLSFGRGNSGAMMTAGEDGESGFCDAARGDMPVDWPRPNAGDVPELPGPELPTVAAGRLLPDIAEEALVHAAVNGRGAHLDLSNGTGRISALPEILPTDNTFATSSGLAADGDIFAEEGTIYQVGYHTEDWRGEVIARSQGGKGPDLWRASDGLIPDSRRWDQRRIVTYGGVWRQPQGVPFRWSELSDRERRLLGSDLEPQSAAHEKARQLVEYIRGRAIEGHRHRDNLLGDIVHSTPVVFGETLFVGGNDGMLHAFDTRTGGERFAYIPRHVLPNLQDLALPGYPGRHRFFVDGPLYAGEVLVGEYQRKSYLVGGLGKGGKGYFSLLVGHRERSPDGDGFGDYQWISHVDRIGAQDSERDVAQWVQWEYPGPRTDDGESGDSDTIQEMDPDLGFSFSQAFCVNGNSSGDSYRPLVIFGNGYNSTHQSAVLYILEAETGKLIRKIDTGIAEENGLSTPALVDVNLDRRVDYAYAGDLRGNLWKFDLRDARPGRWGVAYGEDKDGDGVIDARGGDVPAPLFRAPHQPITSRPDVMVMHSACAAQAPGMLVVFGTGSYLGAPDREDRRQQSIFGLWDYGDDGDDTEHLGVLNGKRNGTLSSGYRLVRQEIEGQRSAPPTGATGQFRVTIDFAMVEDDGDRDGLSANNGNDSQKDDPESIVGWFYDFPSPPDHGAAERVTADTMVRGGKAVFTSFRPNPMPCASGGSSTIYILNACDGRVGQAPDGQPLLPRSFEGRIGGCPLIHKDSHQPDLDRLSTVDQSGRILHIEFVGERWGMVSWRLNSGE